MKKSIYLFVALVLMLTVVCLAACNGDNTPAETTAADTTAADTTAADTTTADKGCGSVIGFSAIAVLAAAAAAVALKKD